MSFGALFTFPGLSGARLFLLQFVFFSAEEQSLNSPLSPVFFLILPQYLYLFIHQLNEAAANILHLFINRQTESNFDLNERMTSRIINYY